MPSWLSDRLPEWVKVLLTPELITVVVAISIIGFLASIVLVPWFFCRIPADYYTSHDRPSLPFVSRPSQLRLVVRVLKNLLGVTLVLLGFLLLFLPGQGLLTIAVGLLLVDFPGKRRFQCWLVGRPAIHRAINALRRRAHQPPLEVEAEP